MNCWTAIIITSKKLKIKKSEVPGISHKTADTKWNFVPRLFRCLLSDLRPKLTRFACSDKGLRSDAMLAHEENSNVSANSVRYSRNFCFNLIFLSFAEVLFFCSVTVPSFDQSARLLLLSAVFYP